MAKFRFHKSAQRSRNCAVEGNVFIKFHFRNSALKVIPWQLCSVLLNGMSSLSSASGTPLEGNVFIKFRNSTVTGSVFTKFRFCSDVNVCHEVPLPQLRSEGNTSNSVRSEGMSSYSSASEIPPWDNVST